MSDEAAADTSITAVELPADAPASFDSPEAAARYFISKKPTAESADEATAETELSDEDNAAPLDEAHGEDEGIDPAATPPIERPKSWTESEDAEWQATPRKLQEKIVARELERDTALRRTQNESAEKLKGLTAKEQQAEQARQQYETQAKAAFQVLLREQTRDFPDIKTLDDVRNLAASDPFRYLQWDSHQKELAAAQAASQQAESRAANDKQTERNARATRETALLIEKVPEFADAKKLDTAQKAAAQLFRDIGYSDKELAELGNEPLLGDHRIQLIINDAMKFRAMQTAKVTALAKPLPPVQRPGTSQPSGGNVGNIQALTQTLSTSGRVDDAVALLVAQRAGNRRRAS